MNTKLHAIDSKSRFFILIFPNSQLKIKPQDNRDKMSVGGKKINMLYTQASGRLSPAFLCLVYNVRRNQGVSSWEGMTCLQENTTNWHRPRRKGALRCSLRTLCSPIISHTALLDHTEVPKNACIVYRHECSDAHRQGFFYCNESLSDTVTDELKQTPVLWC